MNPVQGILLAAGNSSRLGQSKLLVEWNGTTLLEKTLSEMIPTVQNLTLILGHKNPQLAILVKKLKETYSSLTVLFNPSWEEGMGSSVGFGISNTLPNLPVLIHLVDLPRIERIHLDRLIAFYFQDPSFFAISTHEGVSAPPCILPANQLAQFKSWRGPQGLQAFFKLNPSQCRFLELGVKFLDIDTPEDLNLLGNPNGIN